MKVHDDWKPRMEEAAKTLYGKARRCSFNNECGMKMLIVPTQDEITLLHWLLQDFAKENGYDIM